MARYLLALILYSPFGGCLQAPVPNYEAKVPVQAVGGGVPVPNYTVAAPVEDKTVVAPILNPAAPVPVQDKSNFPKF